MKTKIYLASILALMLASSAFAQLTLPRESQRAEVAQTVGDTRVALVYHRPNTKSREVWGKIVPYGEVWRTGANENTTFETSREIKINGQTLPAGKYGLHAIPNQNEWTIIFNKVNDAWGSFTYKPENDQLRITAKPQLAESQETMAINFENIKATTADVAIRWEKIRVPFTIDVGDLNGRTLAELRRQMTALKADDFRTGAQAASWIYTMKMTGNYSEAIGWVDSSLKVRETPNALGLKANLLADSGKKAEAIVAAERAVQLAKTTTPAGNTTELEKRLAEWKANK